ncbi:hypothetical protein Hanom_Chr02g00130651 [Helianthus anomalus]
MNIRATYILCAFALPDPADDNVPLVDNFLAFPARLHDQLIIGQPEGEHIIEIIPFQAFPLVVIPHEDWPFIVDLYDGGVPVFEVDHPDEDLGDGEVFDVAILEVASSAVSVVDISSDSDSDSRESVTSSTLPSLESPHKSVSYSDESMSSKMRQSIYVV